MSIATGRPPANPGICDNFLYDRNTVEEAMINNISFLRAPTILSKYSAAGARVAVVKAKDNLCALLGAGLFCDGERAIYFSSKLADQATKNANAIENVSL